MSIIDDVRSVTDEILGVRDEIGAVKRPVYILTRTWSGDEIGEGTAVDVAVQILPSPYVTDFKHDLRVREGGNIKQGDQLVKSISQESYPNESDVDCTVNAGNVEKWYYFDGSLYEVVSVRLRYVTWDVHVRKTAKQTFYFPPPPEPEPDPEEEP